MLKWGNAASAALCVGLTLWASAATSAEPARADLTRPTAGATYFNKPGATAEAHAEGVRACVPVASRTIESTFGGLVPDLMASAQSNSTTQANIENCMVAHGWRVVRVDDQEASTLRDLPRGQLADRLADRFGAASPKGVIVREFTNEGARGDTVWGAMPGYGSQTQLSVRAVDLTGVQLQPRRKLRKVQRNPPWAIIGLEAGAVRAPQADEALVIVRVVGSGQTNGEGFSFDRVPPAGASPELGAYDVDGRPDSFYAGVRWSLAKGRASEVRERLVAFPAPPGRWRLSQKMGTLDFCLGSPAFDLKAGDVVYLGALDLVGRIGPDMNLAPAQALLAATPDLAAKLKAVDWIADTKATCGGVYIYRLETTPPPHQAQ
jgi:hypothetical protein